jgi:hypothetical protein
MANTDDLKVLLDIKDEDTDGLALLEIYLRIAERKVLNRLYPFGSGDEEIPSKYTHKVVEITQYLWLRRGSEGETSHSENGISRSYEDADIPDSMLSEITPMAGVPI